MIEVLRIRTAKLFLTLLLATWPIVARADDVSNAERSVVRVVVVSFDESGNPVSIGHGTGFAVTAHRVLTNAHVVTADYRRVLLYVVAADSKAAAKARVVYKDPLNDLALLQFDGSLPPLAIFDGKIPDGANVFALGYPGNVDVATATSLSDYVAAKDAVRSQGHFANRRTISGIDAILHTAAIARGNSGGPLLDECGRVIGVNSFTTLSGNGDAPFGFAISINALERFLSAAGQGATKVVSPCLSPVERLAAEQVEAAQKRERVEATRRAAEQSRQHAEVALDHAAQNWTAVAILCAFLGIIGFCAGGLFYAKDRVRPAAVLTVVGLLLAIAGAATFIARPTTDGRTEPAANQESPAINLASTEVPADTTVPESNTSNEVEATEQAEIRPQFQTSNSDQEGSLGDHAENAEQRSMPESVDYNAGL